jgi:hypothetical protein
MIYMNPNTQNISANLPVNSTNQLQSAVVASAGYTSLVLTNLQELQSDADAFFAALEAKVDSADATTVTSLQSSVDSAFTTSESDY